MYEELKENPQFIDEIFRIINGMDDLSTNPNGDLLDLILTHCSRIKDGSRYELLAFVNEKTSSASFKAQDPLIIFLMKMYQEEYGSIQHDPIKLKIKKQIDSLTIDPDPKDDLINIILNNYLIHYGIHAFLITGNERTPSLIQGSRFFLPIEKPAAESGPLLDGLFDQIQEKIRMHADVDRMFFIIRQQSHYMVLDYQVSMRQCIIMDAAGDDRQLNFLHLSRHITEIENIIYVKNDQYPSGKEVKSTSLQKDRVSCSIFSLDHVLSAGQNPDLHTELKKIKIDEGENIGYISWLQAPRELVRNAQSPTFRSKYLELQPKELQPEANQYLKEFSIEKTMKSIKQIGSKSLFFFSDSPSPLSSPNLAMRP